MKKKYILGAMSGTIQELDTINHCTATTIFTSEIKKHCKGYPWDKSKNELRSMVSPCSLITGMPDIMWSRMATWSEIWLNQRNPEWRTYFSGSAWWTHHANTQGSILLPCTEFSACHILFLTALRANGGLGHSLANVYICFGIYRISLGDSHKK